MPRFICRWLGHKWTNYTVFGPQDEKPVCVKCRARGRKHVFVTHGGATIRIEEIR